MAERFAAGGRLVALGATPADRSDARHVAVEFAHPVIVGKRALPALALTLEGGPLAPQLDALLEPGDIVIGFGGGTATALGTARERGCLTIGFAPGAAEWDFPPPDARPAVRQELVETLYHVLWELVHVFFEHRGLLEGRDEGPRHDAGASSFLYPFLAEGETDLDSVLDDVRRSVLMKAEEIGELRERSLTENARALSRAAAEVRDRLDAGGKLLALGNGGSATDAMDLVADLRAIGRRAMDLTEDTSIITAVANDVGVRQVFQRQVIAYGHEGDVALAFSTSGGSANVIEALAEARRRGLATVAMVGYGGGQVAAEGLADHVLVVPSQHIPRIQEAQASLYHVLCDLIGEAPR
jgi:D-sedoheptulose 7-phosphate isomerase